MLRNFKESVSMKDLSVVILNWNSSDLLEVCLESLVVDRRYLEVIVVDNGSDDQAQVALLVQRFGVDRFIALPFNHGVARGRNIGLRSATADTWCVLDVDTKVTPGALLTLHALAQVPSVGVVGPKLVDREGLIQFSCRRLPTLITQLLRRFPALDYFGVLADYELRSIPHDSVLSVGYVIGACQVFRRDVFMAIGPYYEASRFGYEDTDLCLCSLKAGLSVIYEPTAVIAHLERRMARAWSSSITYDHISAMVHFFFRHGYLFRKPICGSSELDGNPMFGERYL